jgi:DNA-binding beta-propeller fold protein YncE
MSILPPMTAETWPCSDSPVAHTNVTGLAVDDLDRVYVLTRDSDAVVVYSREGDLLYHWTYPSFRNAHGLTVDRDGASIFVADNADHTVRKFDRNGELLLTLGISGIFSDTGHTGVSGFPPARIHHSERVLRAAGPFNGCTGCAIAENSDLYVSDGYGNARVHQFSPEGALVRSWGSVGTGPGEFHVPHGIAIDRSDRIFVCDRENDRLQVFDLLGNYLEEWLDVQRPTDVAFSADGLVYVSELWRPCGEPGQASFRLGEAKKDLPGRVSVFTPEGSLLYRWGASSDRREDAGYFVAPHAIAVDSHGDVYVGEVVGAFGVKRGANIGAHQIQKFTRAGVR